MFILTLTAIGQVVNTKIVIVFASEGTHVICIELLRHPAAHTLLIKRQWNVFTFECLKNEPLIALNKFGLHADRTRVWKQTLPVLWVGTECQTHTIGSQQYICHGGKTEFDFRQL